MSNIASSLKKGVLASLSTQFVSVFIQMGINIFLARSLSPLDFGIVIKITAITGFFIVLGNLGIGTAIVQRKQLSVNDKNEFFTFLFFVGILLSFIFITISGYIADFYNNIIYLSISKVLSLSIFFHVINIVPNSILRRNQRFFHVGLIQIISGFISAVFSYFMIKNGFGFMTLIYNYVLLIFSESILTFLFLKINFKLRFHFSAVKEEFNYSFFQFMNNIANYSTRNIDKILVGKFLGDKSLGIYERSFQLIAYPVNQLDRIVGPVLHPVFSIHQDDRNRIFNHYLKLLKIILFLSMPLSIFVFLFSKDIILLLYGSNWISTVPILKIISSLIFIKVVNASTTPIYQSLGYTKYLFYSNILTSVLVIFFILIGVLSKDIFMLSKCVTISYFISFSFHYYFLIKKSFQKSFNDILFIFKPLLISILLIIVFYNFQDYFFVNRLITLGLKMIIFFVVNLFLIIVFKEFRILKEIITK